MVQIFGKIYQGLDLNLEFVLKVRKVEHHKVKVLTNCITFNAKLSYVVKKKNLHFCAVKNCIKSEFNQSKKTFLHFLSFLVFGSISITTYHNIYFKKKKKSFLEIFIFCNTVGPRYMRHFNLNLRLKINLFSG